MKTLRQACLFARVRQDVFCSGVSVSAGGWTPRRPALTETPLQPALTETPHQSDGLARRAAFSLIELLIVIAIIGVMAAMVVAAFSNATQDARGVVALQQTAVLQEALNTWITRESSGGGSIASARTTYGAATTGSAKFDLFKSYLTDSTVAHLTAHPSVANALRTSEMEKTGKYVVLSAWNAGSYPKVQLLP